MISSVRVASATLRGRHRDDGAIDDSDLEQDLPATANDAVIQWDAALEQLRDLVSVASAEDLRRPERQWWDPPDQTTPAWEHVIYGGVRSPV